MNTCFCKNTISTDFNKWILEILGPVILSAKPSEILSFPNSKTNNNLLNIKNIIIKINNISFEEITYCNKCTKVFFYNKNLLNLTLKDKRNLKFLKSIGYPKQYNFDKYLNILIQKIQTGYIPDEIGIFLGYPLKDVIGFIGHPSLKLTKINSWRVYGDEKISDLKLNEFLCARNKMREILKLGITQSLSKLG